MPNPRLKRARPFDYDIFSAHPQLVAPPRKRSRHPRAHRVSAPLPVDLPARSNPKLPRAQRLLRGFMAHSARMSAAADNEKLALRRRRQTKELEKALRLRERHMAESTMRTRILNAISQTVDVDHSIHAQPEQSLEVVSDDDEDDFEQIYTAVSRRARFSQKEPCSSDEASPKPSSAPSRTAPRPKNSRQRATKLVSLPISSSVFAPPSRQRAQKKRPADPAPSRVTAATTRSPLRPLNKMTTHSRHVRSSAKTSPRQHQPPVKTTAPIEVYNISSDDSDFETRSPRTRKAEATSNAIPAGTFYGSSRRPAQSVKMATSSRGGTRRSKASSSRRDDLSDAVTVPGELESIQTRSQPQKSCIDLADSDTDDPLFTKTPPDIRKTPLSPSEIETVRSLTFGVLKSKIICFIKQASVHLRAADFSGLRGSRWLNDEIINAFVALINDRNERQVRGPLRKAEQERQKRLSGNDTEDDDEVVEVPSDTAQPVEVFRRPRPRAYIFNTFFFTRLSQGGYDYRGVRRWLKRAGCDVKSLDLIMFPINLSNFHWVLAAIDLRGKRLLYLDSTGGADTHNVAAQLKKWLHDEVADKYGEIDALDLNIEKWAVDVNPEYTPEQHDGGSCGVFTLYCAEFLERGKRPNFEQKHILTLRRRTALFLKEGKIPED